MNTHEEMIERLPALLDAELDAQEAEATRAHVAGCEVCRERLALLESTVAGLRTLPRHPAPPDLVRRVRRRVRRRAQLRSAFGAQEVATAALLAVVVGGGVLLGTRVLLPEVSDLGAGNLSSLGPEKAARASGRLLVVRFASGDREAARTLVAAAADHGALDAAGQAVRPGQDVPERGLLLFLPEAALSGIVPEGVASLEWAEGGERQGRPGAVPGAWLELRIEVQ